MSVTKKSMISNSTPKKTTTKESPSSKVSKPTSAEKLATTSRLF